MNLTSKRAELVSIWAMVLSLVFFVVTYILGKLLGSFAVTVSCWQILASVQMWLVLAIYFHQCSRAEQEKLDMAQLASSHHGDTIFQGGSDREALMKVAQRRLEFLEKWFIPSFGIFIAIYQITLGVIYFLKIPKDLDKLDGVISPLAGALFIVMMSFTTFLMSRYATGMSTQRRWRGLRAGGSYMLVSAIILISLAVSLVLSQYKIQTGLLVMRYMTPVLLTILGAEIVINTIFDFFRPRIKGQEIRLVVDSRLLGIINEPGGILHTFASVIDYQFGFKVSQTWFYMLIIKACIPLFLFFAAVLYLLSCVVVVGPGQQAIIEKLGRFDENSVAGSGMVFKLPAPFSKAYIYDTEKIHLVNIGFVEDEEEAKKRAKKPLLWGERHYKEEFNLLVSTSIEQSDTEEGGVPVSIVNAAVPVKYKINDLYKFVSNHVEPERRLEAICNSELAKFTAISRMEADNADEKSLIGAGRTEAGQSLKKSMQAQADIAGLGIEIVFVGLQAIHPPVEVSEAYQEVIGAYQEKQKEILIAEAESNKSLTELCGSIDKADQLYSILEKLEDAKSKDQMNLVEKYNKELLAEMENSEGEVFNILSEAQTYKYQRVSVARAEGERFLGRIKAYRAAPEIYKKSIRLDMLKEALKNIRKYVVVADEDDTEIYIVNLEEKQAPDLYNFESEVTE